MKSSLRSVQTYLHYQPYGDIKVLHFSRLRFLQMLLCNNREGRKHFRYISEADSISESVLCTEPFDCSLFEFQTLVATSIWSPDVLTDVSPSSAVVFFQRHSVGTVFAISCRNLVDLCALLGFDPQFYMTLVFKKYFVRKLPRSLRIMGFTARSNSYCCIFPGWTYLTGNVRTGGFVQESPSFEEGQWETNFKFVPNLASEGASTRYEVNKMRFGYGIDLALVWKPLSGNTLSSPTALQTPRVLTITCPVVYIRVHYLLRSMLQEVSKL